MRKKILIGSVVSVLMLILLSFTSIVGYRSVTSDVKISPLFTIRTQRTIDEDTGKVSCEQLGLDTIFNGLVNTWNLSHGNGTYRVYVALRDPDDNVLINDDSTKMEAAFNFTVSFVLDSDDDGWSDYLETTCYYTDPKKYDQDGDGVPDKDDIDPLIDLKVTFTSKRIYASEYTYTWREGESWDWSNTNTDGPGNGTDWIFNSSSEASNGTYTRQNDSKVGLHDIAMWNFTVNKAGLYYIWMRCHRYNHSCSNVRLLWNNESFFEKRWEDGGPGYETCWYQNTTGDGGEWKWSWYGIVDMDVGAGTLKIENVKEGEFVRPGDEKDWMEVDNILITDDPYCHPSNKGVEGSEDDTIGYNTVISWDNEGEGPGGSGPDFYLKTTIAGTINISDVFEVDEDNVLDDWSAVVDVSDEKGNENVPITIELWENDTNTSDTQCDISLSGKTCEITYNLENATWWGEDHVLDTDFMGRTCGEVDGVWSSASDANVIFAINQNDKDYDGITYWQELNIYENKDPFNPNVTNDRYALIVGAGASCKVHQISNIGSDISEKGTYLLYDKGSTWDDYTFEVDVKSSESYKDDDKEEIGVIFRYQDQDNYYIVRWKNYGMRDWIYLQKRVDGNLEKVAVRERKRSVLTPTWYTLQIVLDTTSIKVSIIKDWYKREVFDCQDSEFDDGQIGLYCSKNEDAWFDDVLVVDKDSDTLLEEGFDYGKFFD